MSQYQTVCFMLTSEQIAMIQSLAKDHGDSSASSALRFILDDWTERERQHALALAANSDVYSELDATWS